jgi:ABC-type sugar transport system ATPase subunit
MRDGRAILTSDVAATTTRQLIAAMVGRDLTELFPKTPAKPGNVVLEARNLSSRGRLDDVSMTVRQGEVVGVFGLLGSGLDDLGRAIFGLDWAATGEVLIDGHQLRRHSPADAVARGLGFLTENRKDDGLVLMQSVGFNMTLANLRAFAKATWLDTRAERRTALQFVERFGIRTPSLARKVLYLSGGNQQKVLMARWMMKTLKALIVGEPTRGIDVGAKAEIHRLIDQMARAGLAVLVLSTELPEILGVSDRVLVLREGRINGQFERSEATQELVMARAVGETG